MFGDPDPSGPLVVSANSGNTVTTASFTPPTDLGSVVLVAHAWHDTASGNTTNSSKITDSTDPTGATWTIAETRSRGNDGGTAQNGHIQVSRRILTQGAPAAMTVTTTGTNTGGACALFVIVEQPGTVDTTTPFDTTAEGSNAGSAISAVMDASASDGVRSRLMASDWNVAGNMTAGAGQSALVSQGIGVGPDMRIYLGAKDTLTTPVGTVDTLSTATPTSGNTVNWIAYALRPAAAPAGPVPDGIAVPVAVGTPTAALGLAAAPAGVAVAVALGTPATAVPSTGPAGVAVPVALGAPGVALLAALPSGVGVPVVLGQPSVALPGVSPTGIAVSVAVGQPSTANVVVAAPAGIAVPVAAGSPRVGAGRPVVVRPNTGLVVRPNTGLVVRP